MLGGGSKLRNNVTGKKHYIVDLLIVDKIGRKLYRGLTEEPPRGKISFEKG